MGGTRGSADFRSSSARICARQAEQDSRISWLGHPARRPHATSAQGARERLQPGCQSPRPPSWAWLRKRRFSPSHELACLEHPEGPAMRTCGRVRATPRSPDVRPKSSCPPRCATEQMSSGNPTLTRRGGITWTRRLAVDSGSNVGGGRCSGPGPGSTAEARAKITQQRSSRFCKRQEGSER